MRRVRALVRRRTDVHCGGLYLPHGQNHVHERLRRPRDEYDELRKLRHRVPFYRDVHRRRVRVPRGAGAMRHRVHRSDDQRPELRRMRARVPDRTGLPGRGLRSDRTRHTVRGRQRLPWERLLRLCVARVAGGNLCLLHVQNRRRLWPQCDLWRRRRLCSVSVRMHDPRGLSHGLHL